MSWYKPKSGTKKQGESPFDEALSSPLLYPGPSSTTTSTISTATATSSSSTTTRKKLPSFKKTQPPLSTLIGDDRTFQTYLSEDIFHLSEDPISSNAHDEYRRCRSSQSDVSGREQEEILIEQTDVQDLSKELARERATEMSEVTGSMRQIKDIFQDLMGLVESQQDELDEIEQNALNTRGKTEKGMDELELATVHQDKTERTRAGILCAAVSVVLVLTIWFAMDEIQKK